MHRRTFLQSLKHALKGIFYACRDERNMLIHLIIAAVVILMSFILKLDKIEFLIVLICVAFVLTLETINTSFELMVDLFHGSKVNSIVRMLKDVASGAVLIACIFSALIGSWIFLPRIFN